MSIGREPHFGKEGCGVMRTVDTRVCIRPNVLKVMTCLFNCHKERIFCALNWYRVPKYGVQSMEKVCYTAT